MVTVIAKEEEFSTPVHNGSNNGSNEHERRYSNIKDFQEVDFHLSPSFKVFPEDLFGLINAGGTQTPLNGEFFVQIDEIQLIEPSNSFVLTLTDGIRSVQAVTNGEIPHLNGNVKAGCKLLITGVVPLANGFLQLTAENTKFQFGSRTYPRPRSAYRGRGGSSRPSYEGRRGGGNGYHRHEQNAGETNFFKRPPAKNTLMDFMTTLKISRDSKPATSDEEKRRNPSASTDRPAEVTSTGDSNEAVISDSTDFSEQFDPEDDPTQSIYRERRNPLPPRLQRAQEERSRRNTIRQHDENILILTEEMNGDFRPGATQHQSLMSSPSSAAAAAAPSYFRPSDLRGYFPHPYPTLISSLNNSAPTYVTYFPTNSGHFISNGAYPNENLTFCYGNPYAPVTYLQAAPLSNGGYADERKSFVEPAMTSLGVVSTDENDSTVNYESQIDESNSSERVDQSSSNDENSSTKKFVTEQKNSRPRWKVNDVCLARWSEDRQFYAANILQIQPPFATVVFLDYQNCEQVHFSDLRPLPREQQYSPLMNPVSNVSTSELNPLAASAFYPSTVVDPCVLMPEAPPFPFNSAGTVHLYPTSIPLLSRSNRSHRRAENGETTSQSNETSINDSNEETTPSNEKKSSEESRSSPNESV